MTKQHLEKYQVFIYIAAILTGLVIGVFFTGLKPVFETLLWLTLGFLLYTTFTQISLSKLKHAFQDVRFIATALTGNFVLIPLIVFGMISLLPDNDAIRLGVALVLLVPCTDWFITFTQLGRGETERAIAFSPLSLLFQIFSLPIYLFLFFGNELTVTLATNDMLLAFAGIIILPLIIASLTEKWAKSTPKRQQFIDRIGWMPVPLLTVVIFMISASQSQVLFDATAILWYPAICFVSFLIIMVLLAKVLSKLANLQVGQARVLAFSLGSRNSFVVLPLALALPEMFEITVFVIVLQSLIELFGMASYVWLIPNMVFTQR
ncbi:MAG: hypothetical protein U5K69_24600 [Balneolaceae bacterium]|nr:hypothetical protein [Balneolaceae bacterium]